MVDFRLGKCWYFVLKTYFFSKYQIEKYQLDQITESQVLVNAKLLNQHFENFELSSAKLKDLEIDEALHYLTALLQICMECYQGKDVQFSYVFNQMENFIYSCLERNLADLLLIWGLIKKFYQDLYDSNQDKWLV